MPTSSSSPASKRIWWRTTRTSFALGRSARTTKYNTTIYGLNDRYRGVFGRRDVLFVSRRDLDRLRLAEGDVVDVSTALQFARVDRVVRALTVVGYDMPSGRCVAYYPETQPLVALEHFDPEALTPSYKPFPFASREASHSATKRLS